MEFPQWRAIKDEMPTETALYIIYAPSIDLNMPLRMTAWYDTESQQWSLLAPVWIDAITHWMPMPAGPQAKHG